MNKQNEEFSFESAMKRLEDIINKMSDSSTSLETSLKYYEEAVQLTSQCEQRIRTIEHRVQELSETASSAFSQESQENSEDSSL